MCEVVKFARGRRHLSKSQLACFSQWKSLNNMDRITQLPKTKRAHAAILVVVDKLTKMTCFAPVKNESTAAEIAQASELT